MKVWIVIKEQWDYSCLEDKDYRRNVIGVFTNKEEAEWVTEMLKTQKGYKIQDKDGVLAVEGVDFYILERETDIIFEEED